MKVKVYDIEVKVYETPKEKHQVLKEISEEKQLDLQRIIRKADSDVKTIFLAEIPVNMAEKDKTKYIEDLKTCANDSKGLIGGIKEISIRKRTKKYVLAQFEDPINLIVFYAYMNDRYKLKSEN